MVVPSGSVRILADLGIQLQQDGTLTLNPFALDNAISKNAGAVNAIFSTTKTGIGDVVRSLVTSQTSLTRTRSPARKRSRAGALARPGALGSASGNAPPARRASSSRVHRPFSTHSVARLVSERS